ncbi:MAG: tail fiber domain-containing protein [Bacteroidota bacterium]
MKKYFLLLLFATPFGLLHAQNVGIGTTTPNSNAMLEIRSNNKGVLMPRLSTATKNAMTNVQKGMMVYDSTLSAFYFHDGGKWRLFSERNSDSLVVSNYISNPAVTANMLTNNNNVTTTAASGLLYDNGGPAANYNNSSYDTYVVSPAANDSIVGYRVLVEQMNLAAGDTLVIYTPDNIPGAVFFTGSRTGSFYFAATSDLTFAFLSNASGNAAGYRIRWGIITVNSLSTEAPPLYGWYFNDKKMAVRGGLASSGNWAADSLGRLSFAYGNNAKATGLNAIAMGRLVSASGEYSSAIGLGATASGANTISMGYLTTANGPRSVAIGNFAKALGEESTAIGSSTNANGIGSTAMGFATTASGQTSTAMGGQTIASGIGSTAMGFETTASGENATAMGNGTSATQESATAMGSQTIASGGQSTAMGYQTTAQGGNSTAMGAQTIARSFNSVALGRFNDDFGVTAALWTPGDPLFMIGNGSSDASRSNAMVVLKSGRTGIGTNAPQTKLHIDGGIDASLVDNSGFLVIGDINGANLVFDGNEIVSRNNGANNTLYLQNNGGALEAGGTAAKPGGGSWAATSDERLKQNVTPFNDGLQQLLKINPVLYQYNKLSGYDTEKKYVGVLAQEMKEVAPYMVGTFKKEGTEYYNVDNTAMTYILINSVKEQQKQIEAQRQQIEELKNALNLLLKK